jgi:ribonuclease E
VEDGEPAMGYEPITRAEAVEAAPVAEVAPVVEPDPVVEVAPVEDDPVAAPAATPWVVKDEAADLTVVETQPRIEIVSDAPAADHTLDIATPSLKELAEDVAAAAGSERPAREPVVEVAPEPRPLAEVEIGGPEIDVDEPHVTVRSVDTVSAIDLVMGAGDPSEDRPAADEPPAGA